MHGTRVSAGLDRALIDAANARRVGNPEVALQRLERLSERLETGPITPHGQRVALLHEQGLCYLDLSAADQARRAFSRALGAAGADWPVADPSRAALALLELMCGRAERAQARLAGRGSDRQATLLSLARLSLSHGQTKQTHAALDAAAHAPGGSRDIHPPISALRALTHLWEGDQERCGALADGVSESGEPFWLLVRVLRQRAAWVSTGKSRHLILALSAAEELEFMTSDGRARHLRPLALSQLAVLASLTGDMERSSQLAQDALRALRPLSIPEWPREALVRDLAFVFRATGDDESHRMAVSHLEGPQTSEWAERLRWVTGPRSRDALRPAGLGTGDSSGLEGLGIELVGNQDSPQGALLRGLMTRLGAHGARWWQSKRLVAASGSGCTLDGHKGVPIRLSDNEAIELIGSSKENICAIDHETLRTLAAAAHELSRNQDKIEALCEELDAAKARRDSAVRALERARRGPVAVVTGGTFPTVAGSSPMIRAVLDRLGLLASSSGPVLIEGLTGSGRRHLARALHGALGGVLGQCPMLDMKVVPKDGMREALLGLEDEANGGVFVASSAEEMPPDVVSWLLNRIEEGQLTGRLVLTLEITTSGPIAERLRTELAHGRVVVPALEDRVEDLPDILDKLAFQLGLTPELIDTCARKALARQRWPEQIRTLKRQLSAAMVRAAGGVIREEHLADHEETETSSRMEQSLDAGYHDAIRGFRRDLLRHALTVSDGNRTQAAKLLGVQRTYFMRLIRDLGADDIRPTA